MLRLTVNPDGYGQAALHGEVQSGTFAGEGEAWFTLEEIEAFGSSLVDVSEYVESEATLTGGAIGSTGEEQIATLSLRAYPIDALGHFGVHVVLGEYPGDEGRTKRARSVSVELQAETHSLAALGVAVSSLAKGNRDEAVLESA